MPFPSPPRFRSLLADRRGSTAAMFAAGIVGLFGAFALATDAGVWYAQRRGAQNAADTAASAGVMALAMSGQNAARSAAFDVTSRNGFANTVGGATAVVVNIPPSTGPQSANPTAVEVVVRQRQNMTAAALLLATAPTVEGRSVAILRPAANVCILALTGQVWAGGNVTVNTPNCVIASNRRSGASIDINSGALDINAYSLHAVSRCEDCDSAQVRLSRRYGEYQPPVADPFAHLQSKTMPSNSCINLPGGNGVIEPLPYEDNGNKPYCSMQVNGGREMRLRPGTYYIRNGDFGVQGGGIVNCPTCTAGAGVAIVLTGDVNQIGDFKINANSIVNLRAAQAARDPAYNGILLYRDARAGYGQTNNPSVSLNGGTSMSLVGGLYFPSTHVRINGNAAVIACSVVVAASIDFIGNADVVGCSEVGTTVPQAQMVVVQE
jgi:Flp pilus assembly protein TadG